jgi:hypothetical protein
MTDDKADWLAEAKARCDAADPGPWKWNDDASEGNDLTGPACPILFATNIPPDDPTPMVFVSHVNKPLLASSRTDIPRLIGVVEAADGLLVAIEHGSHLSDEKCGHERCDAIRNALAAYQAARHGGEG